MIDAVLDPERQALVAAIDGRGGRVDEVARTPVAGELQHVAVADKVRLHVGLRVLHAVANAGLRPRWTMRSKSDVPASSSSAAESAKSTCLNWKPVAEIRAQPLQPRPLQRWIVIVVEVVDSDDAVPACKQGTRGTGTDEAGHPRDENRHRRGLAAPVPQWQVLNRAGAKAQTTRRPSTFPGGE